MIIKVIETLFSIVFLGEIEKTDGTVILTFLTLVRGRWLSGRRMIRGRTVFVGDMGWVFAIAPPSS